MNVQDISFVDKPKLGPTNYLALTSMYLTAAISLVLGSLFPSQLFLLFIAFIIVIMVAPIHYCWINTRYELSDSQLRIRSGFYKNDIVLKSIIGVRVDRRYSPLAIHPPIVKYRDRVRSSTFKHTTKLSFCAMTVYHYRRNVFSFVKKG